MHTTITYSYRDESGFAEYETIVLVGQLSESDKSLIQSKLNEEEKFIPGNLSKVRIPELQRRMESFPSDADHVWHKLHMDEIAEVSVAPEGQPAFPVKDFVDSFAAVPGPEDWDIVAAARRLGLY